MNMPAPLHSTTPVPQETAQIYERIGNAIDLCRGKEGSLIQVLHIAQQLNGHLPLDLQRFIASAMHIPLSEVSGVVSFYSFFSTEPRGEHTIRICLGTACYVRGGKKITEHLGRLLGVPLGKTTEDGKFTFEVARCIGSCGLAPALMIDDIVYRQVNINRLEKMLARY